MSEPNEHLGHEELQAPAGNADVLKRFRQLAYDAGYAQGRKDAQAAAPPDGAGRRLAQAIMRRLKQPSTYAGGGLLTVLAARYLPAEIAPLAIEAVIGGAGLLAILLDEKPGKSEGKS